MTSGDVYKLCEEIRDISGHTFKADAYCRVVAVVEGGGGGGGHLKCVLFQLIVKVGI